MPEQSDLHAENEKLADKYRPLLVLFPEIQENTTRDKKHQSVDNEPDRFGPKPGRPPLSMDYHPRDIKLVLDNAHLPVRARVKHRKFWWGWRRRTKEQKRERLLKGMAEDKNKVPYIDLIDRHGPQQVNKFWDTYARIAKKDEEYKRKAYAHVVRGTGWFKDYISIQYWLAYFFDDWANVHEMDWEMVSVIIKKTDKEEEPVACAYCSHMLAFRMPWKDVQKVSEGKPRGTFTDRNSEGTHMVAYIANGSHASYFSDYPPYFVVLEPFLSPLLRMLVRLLKITRPFTDYVPSYEEGKKYLIDVEVIPENENDWINEWRWLKFTGNWGSPVELTIWERLLKPIPLIRSLFGLFHRPIRAAGPKGPNTRGTCWENPFDWVNLECLDAMENRNWIEDPKRGEPKPII